MSLRVVGGNQGVIRKQTRMKWGFAVAATMMLILQVALGGCAKEDDEDEIEKMKIVLTVLGEGHPQLSKDLWKQPVRVFKEKAAGKREVEVVPYVFSLPEGWTVTRIDADKDGNLVSLWFTRGDQKLQVVTFEPPACQLYRSDWVDFAREHHVDWEEVSKKYATDRDFWKAVMQITPADVDLNRAKAGHLQEAREKCWMIIVKEGMVLGASEDIRWAGRFRSEHYRGLIHWKERTDTNSLNVFAVLHTEGGDTDAELLIQGKTMGPEVKQAFETILATFRRIKQPVRTEKSIPAPGKH